VNETVDLEMIRDARRRIAGRVKRTPLERSDTLSRRIGANVFIKQEMLQTTGSFKLRGAFNKILSLSEDERQRGVVAVSGGNHAQAIAYAGAALAVKTVVLMPEGTPSNYVEATRGYGGRVSLQPSIAAAFEEIERYKADGLTFVHPFDDPLVMAGQGTLGLEIMEDLPDATDVFVSIGGGGLAGGVSSAIKAVRPETRVWGVETEGADAMSQAMTAGHPVTLSAVTSIAKTLGAPSVSDRTLEIARRNVECVTVVSDAEAAAAVYFILERLKLLAEPAASCTLAAAERLKGKFTPASNVVLILCGGNLSIADLCGYSPFVHR
jgi:threonine dehydratase